MNTTIIQRLNEINRIFYEVTADEFDATRGQAWAGWRGLLPYLDAMGAADGGGTRGVLALDVGCGNGRFGVFLAQHVRGALVYHGIDSNAALLEHARSALVGTTQASSVSDTVQTPVGAQHAVPLQAQTRLASSLQVTLEQRDIVENPPDTGAYDLVALFGVLHHIPGGEQRRDLIRRLAERVKPGGLLVFTAWRFYEYERFRERIVPFPDDLRAAVEPGDYLLDWRRGERALRYCHYVADAEHAALVAASGMDEIAAYRADGHSGAVNRYSVLCRAL